MSKSSVTVNEASKVRALGFFADLAIMCSIILAICGMIATYYDLARAIRFEALALVLLAAGIIATLRGSLMVLKGSEDSGYYSKQEPDFKGTRQSFDRIAKKYKSN